MKFIVLIYYARLQWGFYDIDLIVKYLTRSVVLFSYTFYEFVSPDLSKSVTKAEKALGASERNLL